MEKELAQKMVEWLAITGGVGSMLPWVGLAVLIFLVAFLYASVGHGGASGYLAVMSFFGFSQGEMASTALLLNILVASLAFEAYRRHGHFSWRLTWPFIIASVPAAFLGGLWKISPKTYALLLAITLLFAAFRLAWVPAASSQKNADALSDPLPTKMASNSGTPNSGASNSGMVADNTSPVPLGTAIPAGGVIGLLSGMVGVGGGIFLSPLMLLAGWAEVKQVSAVSALFIVVNAMSGLLGRYMRGGIEIGNLWLLLLAALIGGWLGAYYGAARFSGQTLRRILAFVLLLAAFKLFLPYFHG